jgi:glucose/arabinose dehydrogenase
LVNNDVRRLTLQGKEVIAEEILFTELSSRIRDVRTGPDGLLYIITDGAAGKVVRVSPK